MDAARTFILALCVALVGLTLACGVGTTWDQDPDPGIHTYLPFLEPERTTYVTSGLNDEWPVREAVAWIDRYTDSSWVLVDACPADAWRCIDIMDDVPSLARQDGLTPLAQTDVTLFSYVPISVDVIRCETSIPERSQKGWVLAHELAHAAGLHHHESDGHNLMYPSADYLMSSLTEEQKTILRRY